MISDDLNCQNMHKVYHGALPKSMTISFKIFLVFIRTNPDLPTTKVDLQKGFLQILEIKAFFQVVLRSGQK